jgi:hypothetical protein
MPHPSDSALHAVVGSVRTVRATPMSGGQRPDVESLELGRRLLLEIQRPEVDAVRVRTSLRSRLAPCAQRCGAPAVGVEPRRVGIVRRRSPREARPAVGAEEKWHWRCSWSEGCSGDGAPAETRNLAGQVRHRHPLRPEALVEDAIPAPRENPSPCAPGGSGDVVPQTDDCRCGPGDHQSVIGFGSSFLLANGALIVAQSAQVALPGRGVPQRLTYLRAGRRQLVVPVAVLAFVVAGALGRGVATALSQLAFVAVPLLAAAALGWAARGAKPVYALLAPPLLALAWWRAGSLTGDAAAAVLSALSCVTLGRLLAGVAKGGWLKAGILAWAVYDAVTVFGSAGRSPDATVDGAVPAAGLPQLQWLDLHAAGLGYADVFVAAVLGGVLAAERRRAWPVALLVLGVSIAFDALFLAFDTLPATVPVALALVVSETRRRSGRLLSRRPVATRAPGR